MEQKTQKIWSVKEWVDNWKSLGPHLQSQRDADIRNSDTAKSIEQLEWSYRYAKNNYPLSDSSGLIDFYKILLKDRS